MGKQAKHESKVQNLKIFFTWLEVKAARVWVSCGSVCVSWTGLCTEADLTERFQLSPGGFPFILTHSTVLRADSLLVSACQSAECGDDSINLHLNPRWHRLPNAHRLHRLLWLSITICYWTSNKVNRPERSKGTRVVCFYCSFASAHGKEGNHGPQKRKIIALTKTCIGHWKANMILSTLVLSPQQSTPLTH